MKDKLKAWFVAGRFFAVPWLLCNTLLGVTLAGFSLYKWLLAFVITTCVLTAGHYLNNIVDYRRGLDKPEGGSKAKAYTSASQVLPSGALSVSTMVLTVFIFLLVGLTLFYCYCPHRFDILVFFVLGVAMTLGYHDLKIHNFSRSWFIPGSWFCYHMLRLQHGAADRYRRFICRGSAGPVGWFYVNLRSV